MNRRKSASALVALLLLVTLLVSATAASASGATATYQVTITNLTGGQPFTPPILATHRQSTNVFQLGEAAGNGLQQVAENGGVPVLVGELEENKHVFEIAVGGVPLVPPGTPGSAMFPQSDTYTITSDTGAKYLSFVSMLVCTNDGFAGLDSLRLPKQVGDSTTVYADAYDAGTEMNTEYFGDLVPPCQGLIGVTGDPGTGMTNPALAEGGVVHPHAGIQGISDLLPGVHGWSDPVAEIVITRID